MWVLAQEDQLHTLQQVEQMIPIYYIPKLVLCKWPE